LIIIRGRVVVNESFESCYNAIVDRNENGRDKF
jgi:hypothetical protein